MSRVTPLRTGAALLAALDALLRAPVFGLGAERRALNLLQQFGMGGCHPDQIESQPGPALKGLPQ